MSPHPKWCDFGLSVLKLHTATTFKQSHESAQGTLRWMAPELLQEMDTVYSTKSDIWALGMVYFELASRKIPYSMGQDAQVGIWIVQGKTEKVSVECQTESPVLADIMQRCWAERTARPATAEITRELGVSDSDYMMCSR